MADIATIYVRRTKQMGLGVFAARRIRKGEVIERCPVLPLTPAEERKIQSMSLRDYTFEWGDQPSSSAIVLGYGSLYNHSDQPNARYRQRRNRKQMEFIALRDIRKDEQIFIDYEWPEKEYVLCGVQRTPQPKNRVSGPPIKDRSEQRSPDCSRNPSSDL